MESLEDSRQVLKPNINLIDINKNKKLARRKMSNPYFLQTKEWSKFWLAANPENHKVHKIETDLLSGYIYQYPWIFGQNFLYTSKSPFLKKPADLMETRKDFRKFLNQIEKLAKDNNSTFIKFDFDSGFLKTVNIKNDQELLSFANSQVCCNKEFLPAKKKIQYTKTSVLDCSNLKLNINPEKAKKSLKNTDVNGLIMKTLSDFFLENKDFWKLRNSNVRRYTKKALNQPWQISMVKDQDNLKAFLEMQKVTSKRQGFTPYPTNYFKKFFEQNFSRIIILRDQNNKTQAAWMGAAIEDTLVYSYGGNSQYSFKNQGQYLIHLIATYIAAKEKLKKYDLGGYDENEGYGKFKANYKGEIIDFLKPLDLPLKPTKYKVCNSLIKVINLIRNPFVN